MTPVEIHLSFNGFIMSCFFKKLEKDQVVLNSFRNSLGHGSLLKHISKRLSARPPTSFLLFLFFFLLLCFHYWSLCSSKAPTWPFEYFCKYSVRRANRDPFLFCPVHNPSIYLCRSTNFEHILPKIGIWLCLLCTYRKPTRWLNVQQPIKLKYYAVYWLKSVAFYRDQYHILFGDLNPAKCSIKKKQTDVTHRHTPKGHACYGDIVHTR